ncbi:hypothetical protein F441_00908 [Phytophthora nicotianae CJ01A1]|uniref:Uncharacterized protein n=5 Tax=Phytophthora nicotianae TaxID=4792 RepID=V9FZR3_PHYNI|nr:hypothetical protein F443_00930 [Phytophthora nicotianae P1569]ETK96369.1 hypothetical protein L915_00874 [Phytophthora nicotianae]ETO85310.1 hypothetical protein F444_00941 [Phytophthora nicotianae P1976]ETP26377.1 hypothetical protein F441_00908 [Phytophthora nicotianae CJ01A1]ETP54357.1 hypothetical protein F442_00886 [Phytophthora nicotianae P10297]
MRKGIKFSRASSLIDSRCTGLIDGHDGTNTFSYQGHDS